jgi:hypothetical protein
MDTHSGTVAPFVLVLSEFLDHICLSVSIGISQGNVPSIGFRKTRLHIYISIIIYCNVPRATFEAIHHHQGNEILREK